MDIIECAGLTIGYHGSPVLEELSFAVPQGEISVIAGPSGCGKTTLLKTLIGLNPPLSGTYRFMSGEVDFASERSLLRLYDRIGVLYQGGALLNSLTLAQNVALPVRMRHPRIGRDLLDELVRIRLEQVGLGGSAGKYPSELSGGMRKRGALARAMVLDPEVLFCDEPSAGLDPLTSAALDELLLGLKSTTGMTLVVVTHELRSIDKIADRLVLLQGGRLHYAGLPAPSSGEDAFMDAFFLRRGRHDDQ